MAEAIRIAEKALGRGEFPVGCVIVCGDRIVGTGDRLNSIKNELDHAEILALRDWLSRGKPGSEPVAYTTLEPCLMCLGALILNGVREIVFAYEDVMGGATGIDFEQGFSRCLGTDPPYKWHLYRHASNMITAGVLRRQSLELFKRFFLNPRHDYLRGTLLERYTLSQE